VLALADRVEAFVRNVVAPYEQDPRRDHHGAPPTRWSMNCATRRARRACSPHIRPDGSHLTQRETAVVLIRSGLSPLGPLACNTAAPDEGNMYLIRHVASPALQERFLAAGGGRTRSAFFMTEPAELQGAGADPR
jgi:acyl-CoA dehydrogenase